MKLYLTLIFFAGVLSFSSCTKSTDVEEYNSIWKPYSETVWIRSGSAPEEFTATNGGFSFKANIADTGTYIYTFIPAIYIVSNMTSASDATISFRGAIIGGTDTLQLSAGGSQLHSFGVLSGTVQSKGADSVLTVPKAFGNTAADIALSVNPDQCSRELRINVQVAWNPFTGGTTVNPLPKTKKVSIEFFDVQMRVNGIDVLSK